MPSTQPTTPGNAVLAINSDLHFFISSDVYGNKTKLDIFNKIALAILAMHLERDGWLIRIKEY